jgi:hypothetical protein
MSTLLHLIRLVLLATTLSACAPQATHQTPAALPLVGTWKLIRATHIEKGDTVVTDKTKGVSFIKIINDTHFAFLQHGLAKASSPADFVAGGGRYTLADSLYTEQLDYCSARDWEGNAFAFTVSIKGDTLVQRGIEKVASAGVNRVNIEQYVRLRKQ